ncbi:MAG: hypothetical protein SFV23_15195 [Planctomycetaceae bacterium]|nr:hypothetical protein [Planctomycetaceae bacterium]
MIDHAKYVRIVDRLIEGTNSRSISWKISARRDSFVTVLGSGMIEICRNEQIDEDGHPIEWFDLFIMDSSGNVADRLSSSTSLSGWDSTAFEVRRLAELYKAARGSAIATGTVVDEILGELLA